MYIYYNLKVCYCIAQCGFSEILNYTNILYAARVKY